MKKVLAFFVLLCVILCLAGCRAEVESSYDDLAPEKYADNNGNEGSYSLTADTETADTTQGLSVTVAENQRKLIKRINLRVETAGYSEYITSLRTAVSEAKGYIESFEERDTVKNAGSTFVIRIPADNTDAFLNVAGSGVTVLSRREDMSDVTGEYVDMSARMTALEAEEKSLLALLGKAQSVSEILTVRERLSQVRSDIEAFKAKLNTYDNLVSYSTVTLTVNEVPREKEKESVWRRIGNNFVDAGNNIGGFFVDAFVFILAALPYIAIIAVPGVVVLIIIVKRKRAKK